jgi:hypothetical protein
LIIGGVVAAHVFTEMPLVGPADRGLPSGRVAHAGRVRSRARVWRTRARPRSDGSSRSREGGARRVELRVEADNARAIRFYENAGFAREGVLGGALRRAGEDRDVDEIVMARLLA